MKAFMLLTVASIISTGAFASGMSVDIKQLYTGTTFAPTTFGQDCAQGIGNACLYSTTSSATYLSSTLLLLKEEVQQVEPDAYQFLAGEEKTLALDNVINLLREDSSELDSLSDLEITAIMVEGL